MALTCISKNQFQEDLYFSHFAETRRFIVTVQAPTHGKAIEGGKISFAKKIGVYDKRMNFIREIPFKDYAIEKVMVKANEDTIAIACPMHHRLIIMDLELDQQSEVPLYKWSDFEGDDDDVDERGLYPSLFYWWSGDILYSFTTYKRIYRIDTSRATMSIIDEEQLKNECPELSQLITAANKYNGIIWLNPYKYQFTYYDDGMVGFVDVKNGIHQSALYMAPDVHRVYFYNDTFIVLNCYSIELVKKDGIAKAYALSKESYRMERSLFIAQLGTIIVVDSYWTGSVNFDSLLHCSFDGKMSSFTEKEKVQYDVIKQLYDNPSNIKTCMRLVLMEVWDDCRLSYRWFDILRYNNIETVYIELILARSDVSGHLYNSLRLATHEDPKIMAAIKFAMSRYLKKRGDMNRYEQVLLKSIEYYPECVKSLAELGKFYLDYGRHEEGVNLIKTAINNVKVVYGDEDRNTYDRYDIEEFVNQYFIGAHMTAKAFSTLVNSIQVHI